jgi:hypothetical protein
MALVFRPEDNKVISVSRKTILCHEEVYATFDATKSLSQLIEFKQIYNIPDHVLSIKVLDDYKRNQEFNENTPTNPPRTFLKSISPHPLDQGENPSELLAVGNLDLVMEEIQRVKERLKLSDAEEGKAEAIMKALEKLEFEIQNKAPRKGGLKRKAAPGMSNVDASNILGGERQRNIDWRLTDFDEDEKESPGKRMMKRNSKGMIQAKLKKGDRVSIPTKTFGDEYAKGKEKTSYGIVKSM